MKFNFWKKVRDKQHKTISYYSMEYGIEITSVQLWINKTANERVLANVAIEINNCFCIKNIKLIQAQNGYKLQFPSFVDSKNERHTIVHPFRKNIYQFILEAVLEKFEKMKENDNNG